MEFDEGLFVDYVKETPIVWDRFSPKFRLKNEKMSAWMNIGSKFGLTGTVKNLIILFLGYFILSFFLFKSQDNKRIVNGCHYAKNIGVK